MNRSLMNRLRRLAEFLLPPDSGTRALLTLAIVAPAFGGNADAIGLWLEQPPPSSPLFHTTHRHTTTG